MSTPPLSDAPQPSRLPALLILSLAALLTVLAGRALLFPPAPPLPVLATLPEFHLSDQQRQDAGSAQLRGRAWIAGFVFTRCPSTCPALTARMREIRDRIAPLGDSALLVSISVDPEHDTPDVLASWSAEQGIVAPRWLVVRGTPEATRSLIRSGFLLALDDSNRADPNALLHDTRLVLVDQELRIRGYYDSADPGRVDQLVRDLERLADGPG